MFARVAIVRETFYMESLPTLHKSQHFLSNIRQRKARHYVYRRAEEIRRSLFFRSCICKVQGVESAYSIIYERRRNFFISLNRALLTIVVKSKFQLSFLLQAPEMVAEKEIAAAGGFLAPVLKRGNLSNILEFPAHKV